MSQTSTAQVVTTRSALPATETDGRLPPGGRRHLQHRHGVLRRRGPRRDWSCSRASGQQPVSKMSVKGRRHYSAARHNTAGQSRNERPEPRSRARLDRFPKPCVAGSNPAGGTAEMFGRGSSEPAGRGCGVFEAHLLRAPTPRRLPDDEPSVDLHDRLADLVPAPRQVHPAGAQPDDLASAQARGERAPAGTRAPRRHERPQPHTGRVGRTAPCTVEAGPDRVPTPGLTRRPRRDLAVTPT